jgi:hypothetical protein
MQKQHFKEGVLGKVGANNTYKSAKQANLQPCSLRKESKHEESLQQKRQSQRTLPFPFSD